MPTDSVTSPATSAPGPMEMCSSPRLSPGGKQISAPSPKDENRRATRCWGPIEPAHLSQVQIRWATGAEMA